MKYWELQMGFSFYRLSHDRHFDIDRDVSTALCRSSSGDRVDLLSRTNLYHHFQRFPHGGFSLSDFAYSCLKLKPIHKLFERNETGFMFDCWMQCSTFDCSIMFDCLGVWLCSITGSPSSKYEHRRTSALLHNIRNTRICMGKKPIVSVTYENERISIKNSLPYL